MTTAAVNAGCDPEEVTEALGDDWAALLDTAELQARDGELAAMARWARRMRWTA